MSFLKSLSFTKTTVRHISKRVFKWYDEGIQYPGFKYYPRKPETFQEPPYNPSKLFRVEKIKTLKHAPYWEKKIMAEFHLDGKLHSYAVVKNIPENNQRLWRVKHLVKIVPITFPDGLPQEDDVTYLQENGELKIIKKINAVDENKFKLSESFSKELKRMDGDTLRRQSRQKWLNGWEQP